MSLKFLSELNVTPRKMFYELVLVGGTVVIYQFIQFVLHSKNKPKEPEPRDDAKSILSEEYIPKSFTAKALSIPDQVKATIDTEISDKSALYPLSEASLRLTQSDTSKDFAFGYGWDSKNILHIHCNTIFPNATPRMLRFWFINHANGRGKYHFYKWWHPNDHVRAWWDDKQIHPVHDQKNGYVGHTSYVYEYLCKGMKDTEMDYLRIHFVDPKEYGFTQSMIDSDDREIVCAKSGFMPFQTESAKFIHYFEKYGDNACIMKSRFWIGEASVDNTVPVPLRWIIGLLFSFPFMRKIMIPGDIGKRVLMHCAQEMNNLSKFLPELYNLCQQNA